MLFHPKGNNDAICTDIYVEDNAIPVVTHTRYLGHIICNTLSDNLDINRQIKQIYT